MRTTAATRGSSRSDLLRYLTVAGFAALPFITLLANNQDQTIRWMRLLLWWGVVTIPLLLLLFLFQRIRPLSFPRVATFVPLAVYVFFQLAQPLGTIVRARTAQQIGAVTLAAILLVYFSSRHEWTEIFARALGMLAIVAAISPLLVGVSEGRETRESTKAPWDLTIEGTAPDIYWIILDGYGRFDTLRNLGISGIDELESSLVRDGFAIASEAKGNYPLTHLSLASTLDSDYIVADGSTVADQEPFFRAMQGDNRVVATLRNLGYSFILWPADRYSGTRCTVLVDVCLYDPLLGNVEWALLERTPLAAILDSEPAVSEFAIRSDPVHAIEAALVTRSSMPTFAQIHLMSPHPPYNGSGPQCEAQPDDWNWKTLDDYVSEVECLNPRILQAVDALVRDAPNAIVILQSDHGPALGINLYDGDLDQVASHEIETSLAVFSAMRLPPECDQPPDLSLINTFRIIFNCIAREDLPLLPHHAFIGNHVPGDVEALPRQ